MDLKEMLVISEDYPNPANPCRYVFVEQLVNELARKDIKITVINPVYHNYAQLQYKEKWSYDVNGGQTVTVYQPKILNFSWRKIGIINLMKLSYKSFYSAVVKTVKKNHLNPDVIYSHFIFPSGCVAAELGKKIQKPSFCATGESNLLEILDRGGLAFFRKKLSDITGIISVSSENKRILAQMNWIDEDTITVVPNCVEQNLFYPHEKKAMREKYGIKSNQIVGAFLGSFSERKGVKRVNSASDNASIPMIYIGSGELKPEGNNVVFSGEVIHDLIPEYLSAADFFVLPTKSEGCCNAIVEAICCGLPIISSNGRFNDDILDDGYSIRVDPDDVQQIEDAMVKLSTDKELRQRMSNNAVSQRKKFNLEVRANTILRFMTDSIEKVKRVHT